MKLNSILAAGAALSLAAAPVAAQAATAAAPRAGAEVSDAENLRGGFIIPLIAVVAILLGILAATNGDDDDLPHSP